VLTTKNCTINKCFGLYKAIIREAAYKGIQIEQIIINGAVGEIKYRVFHKSLRDFGGL
jgi:hypothetical protein